MASLEAILQGIEDRLGAIDGLSVGDLTPGAVNPPAAVVGVPPIGSYRSALGGHRPVLEPTITLLVSSAISQLGQHQLARYADPEGASSIVAAVEADRTLGGMVDDCEVRSFTPLGMQEVGIIGYFGGIFVLRIATT